MGKHLHREITNTESKKPFGDEIRQLNSNHPYASSSPQRGRPQKVGKEKKFGYLLYIPVELHNSLIEYINSNARREETMRSIILAGLEDELEDLKAGKIKNDYQYIEKSTHSECKYLLNIPITANRLMDEIVKALRQDAITKRSIILMGLQNKLRALSKERLKWPNNAKP